jgi:hypothetical protein
VARDPRARPRDRHPALELRVRLVPAPRCPPRTQELSLARCVGLRGAKALAGLCAAPLPALRRLDLSRTRLRPSALRAVGAAPWCAALAELDVRNHGECIYSDRAIDAICAALRKPPLASMAAGGRLREDFEEEPPSDDGCHDECTCDCPDCEHLWSGCPGDGSCDYCAGWC